MQRKAVVSVLRAFVNYRKICRPPSHKAESSTYQINCTTLLGLQWREISLLSLRNKGSPLWKVAFGLGFGQLVGFQEEEICLHN